MIRIGLKTGRKLVHFCTAFVVHFYTTLDNQLLRASTSLIFLDDFAPFLHRLFWASGAINFAK